MKPKLGLKEGERFVKCEEVSRRKVDVGGG
jgi:hypothetical protein